jgi:hypothetical protein
MRATWSSYRFQLGNDRALGLGENDIDPNPLFLALEFMEGLPVSLDAVDRLDEILELEADAQKDRVPAEGLIVGPAADHHRFAGHLLDPAAGKISSPST